jgi:hypothetical protein
MPKAAVSAEVKKLMATNMAKTAGETFAGSIHSSMISSLRYWKSMADCLTTQLYRAESRIFRLAHWMPRIPLTMQPKLVLYKTQGLRQKNGSEEMTGRDWLGSA